MGNKIKSDEKEDTDMVVDGRNDGDRALIIKRLTVQDFSGSRRRR